jgi:hypothetical protein
LAPRGQYTAYEVSPVALDMADLLRSFDVARIFSLEALCAKRFVKPAP